MKRIVSIIFLLWILSCSSPSYYTLDVFVWGDEPYLPNEGKIKANSDEEAYKKAIALLDLFVGEQYINSFVDFHVIAQDGKEVSKRDDFIPKIVKMRQERATQQETKAYAGAMFGMSKNEVYKIPHFSSLNNNPHDRIGGVDYIVDLLFKDNDILNGVSFQTEYNSFEETIHSILNFEEVIEQSYGKPTISGTPFSLSRNEINRGLGKYEDGLIIYSWIIGKKLIHIGIKGDRNLTHYKMFANILYQNIAKDALKKHQKAIESSSLLF